MSETKRTPIAPYVTARGGIVILNGPFPVDEAERIAKHIEVSYAAHDDLVAALRDTYAEVEGFRAGLNLPGSPAQLAARAALAKAEGK